MKNNLYENNNLPTGGLTIIEESAKSELEAELLIIRNKIYLEAESEEIEEAIFFL